MASLGAVLVVRRPCGHARGPLPQRMAHRPVLHWRLCNARRRLHLERSRGPQSRRARRTNAVAAHSIETGHGRAGDHVHACPSPCWIPGVDPVQPFYGFHGPRLAPCGRHLSFHETHYLLAADLPRTCVFLGRAHGLAGRVRPPRLARACAVCRIDLLGHRLRYDIRASGPRGRPADRNQIHRFVVRRAHAIHARGLLRVRSRADCGCRLHGWWRSCFCPRLDSFRRTPRLASDAVGYRRPGTLPEAVQIQSRCWFDPVWGDARRRGGLAHERRRERRSDRTCYVVAARRTTTALHVDQDIIEAILTGDRRRKTGRPRVGAGHAGIGRSTLPARLGCTRLCRRDFTSDRLRPTGPIAAGTAHQIDVDMIVVSGVVTGRQNGREMIAGGKMDVAQEPLLFRGPVPPVLYGNPTSVRERESGDIERIAECVFGNARTPGADHATTGIGGDLLDLRDRLAEPSHRRRLYTIANPAIERRDDRTRQRRGWRKCCRHDRRDRLPACGTERWQAALRRLINGCLIRALLRLVGWRLVSALWCLIRRSAVSARCVTCRCTIARQLGIVRNIVG